MQSTTRAAPRLVKSCCFIRKLCPNDELPWYCGFWYLFFKWMKLIVGLTELRRGFSYVFTSSSPQPLGLLARYYRTNSTSPWSLGALGSGQALTMSGSFLCPLLSHTQPPPAQTRPPSHSFPSAPRLFICPGTGPALAERSRRDRGPVASALCAALHLDIPLPAGHKRIVQCKTPPPERLCTGIQSTSSTDLLLFFFFFFLPVYSIYVIVYL